MKSQAREASEVASSFGQRFEARVGLRVRPSRRGHRVEAGRVVPWMVALAVAVAAAPAQAQANLDAGKSPAQIFADTCNACHRSPRELRPTSAGIPAGTLYHRGPGSGGHGRLSCLDRQRCRARSSSGGRRPWARAKRLRPKPGPGQATPPGSDPGKQPEARRHCRRRPPAVGPRLRRTGGRGQASSPVGERGSRHAADRRRRVRSRLRRRAAAATPPALSAAEAFEE